MADYDEIAISRLFVFGDEVPSLSDFNQHIRSGSDPEYYSLGSMLEYLTSGAGRYAFPSLFPAVKKFFDSQLDDDEYTFDELVEEIDGLGEGDLTITISHYRRFSR